MMLIAYIFNGRGFIPVLQGYGPNIEFLCQRSGISSISWTTFRSIVYGKLDVDGQDVLPWFCCRWLCHPDRQWCMAGLLRLFMSSWKYAGAYASLKGTFRSFYFPKGNVKAVLGIEASLRGILWFPAWRSKAEKYYTPLSFEKMSSTLGKGHMSFHMTLFRALQIMTRHFPPSPLGMMMGADPARVTTVYDFCLLRAYWFHS